MKLSHALVLLVALAPLAPSAYGGTNKVHAGAGTAVLDAPTLHCTEGLSLVIVEGPSPTFPFVTMVDGAPSEEPICNLPNPVGVSATGTPETGFAYEDACASLTVGPLGPATEVHYVERCSGYTLDGVVSFL